MIDRRSFLGAAAALPVASLADPQPPPAKARLRPAICAYSFRKELAAKTMTYEDLVRLAAGLEMDGLDLTVYWFPNTSPEFLLPLRRLAYKLGVELYSISVRTEMTRPMAELRDKEVAELKQWIDVAAALGAGHVRVFGGRVPQGATEEQAAGWAAEVLKRGAEHAATRGVVLGLENHGGITEKAVRILDIVKRVDSPWVGVNLDTGNFRGDALAQIEKCVPYAVNVQVKARTDWSAIAALLRRGGYRGYLALEYEDAEPAPTAVPKLAARLRELCLLPG